MTVLVWFRRDFRLTDNPALTAAVQRRERVVPVVIHAPEEQAPWAPGGASNWWLHHSLAALEKSCAALGSPLVLKSGPARTTLKDLIAETGATAVYWNRLYDPALITRDKDIKEALKADGIAVESFNSALLF